MKTIHKSLRHYNQYDYISLEVKQLKMPIHCSYYDKLGYYTFLFTISMLIISKLF
jgi:hypothetical protein